MVNGCGFEVIEEYRNPKINEKPDILKPDISKEMEWLGFPKEEIDEYKKHEKK